MQTLYCTLLHINIYIWSEPIFFLIDFSRFSWPYYSLVLSQSGLWFILSRSTCVHWPHFIDNSCPLCFSNSAFLSQYVCHSLSCSTLSSPSITMGRISLILYSALNISLLRIVKYILALAAMVGYPTITWSSNTYFWNCRASDSHWYDWSLLSVVNWCSSNVYLVCSGLGLITVILLSN